MFIVGDGGDFVGWNRARTKQKYEEQNLSIACCSFSDKVLRRRDDRVKGKQGYEEMKTY